jgi:serine/threonine protein phosphatase PrpC
MSAMQGWRRSMEDSHIANLDIGDGVSLFAVFDGHGGT